MKAKAGSSGEWVSRTGIRQESLKEYNFVPATAAVMNNVLTINK